MLVNYLPAFRLLTGSWLIMFIFISLCMTCFPTTCDCFCDFHFVHNFNKCSYNVPWLDFLFISYACSFLSFLGPMALKFNNNLRKPGILSSLPHSFVYVCLSVCVLFTSLFLFFWDLNYSYVMLLGTSLRLLMPCSLSFSRL